ncbi:DoxX family protein [Pedobacter miscanthi]|uniref:DoxX family protein n=1 Tax=Pedobacter miscanthi TaxID=2259170 RepID=A0A366L225_9SPHI|nr:DoxX family protein [Pedobacter miscanthi]RBQ07917.1 DoxX family protein [Pedobacter miscanthi]
MKSRIFSLKSKDYKLVSPLFLRLIIGSGFLIHGWAKLHSGSPAGFEKLLILLGIPLAHLMAWITPIVEMLGGLAILLGFLSGMTAIPLILTMLVALFSVHIKNGFSSINTIGLDSNGPVFGQPGYEINLLYIAGLLSLMFTGSGIFSLDKFIVAKRSK